MHIITIVGLGPGDVGLLTLETMEVLAKARTLLLRTARHPSVLGLTQRGIQFKSYDCIYEQQATFEAVYSYIADDCIRQARENGNVVYAVPGSPLVAEKTVALIRARAEEKGVEVRILPGMSFLEVLYTRLNVDPVHGITVVDASDIKGLPSNLMTPLVVTQLYDRAVASDAKLALMECYPDDYPVILVRNLGLADEEIISLPLYELDRVQTIDHLTSAYLPGRKHRQERFHLEPLIDIMARLRSPAGCLWDIEQSHPSLRRYLVEEVYEVLEAIDLAAPDKLCEELGDVLLQVVFHARIAEETGDFSMQDVINGVCEKMIRRHPHVFGDITVNDAAEVVVNWEQIKKLEKGGQAQNVLSGIPAGLPSLMRAFKMQGKAAKVGFNWDNIEPVWEKIKEELAELHEAIDSGHQANIEGELGDVLFAVVNLARFISVEPETALNRTNNKFERRFNYIEETVKKQGKEWKDYTIGELDCLWSDAKRQELKKNA